MANALTHLALRRRYEPSGMGFRTTAEVAEDVPPVGQPRATAAIALAAELDSPGFNLFAFGAPGTGIRELLMASLGRVAASRPAPPDLCYVHNFDDPYRPHLLALPAGRGAELRRDMASLVDELRTALAAAFESDAYRRRRESIDQDVKARSEQRLNALGEKARRGGFALLHTPMGFAFTPMRGDVPLSSEDFEALPEEERARLRERVHAFQAELADLLHEVPAWERERGARIRDLDREIVQSAVGNLVDTLRKKYADVAAAAAHIDRVARDLLENARALLVESREQELPDEVAGLVSSWGGRADRLRRYEVNLLVDHEGHTGAPVLFEENPSYENLVGRIDFVSRFGALATDFTLIRAGALHRAHGGFLVLDALRMLRAPYAWDALKLALRSGAVRIEPLSRLIGLGSPVALDPEPLGVKVRVALVGTPWLYHLLSEADPEVRELFKVPADFADDVDATDAARDGCARLLAARARRLGLLAFEAGAVARLLEESARRAGAQDRLSMRIDDLEDLMREADRLARAEPAATVAASHLDAAIAAREFRLDRLRERFQEETLRGAILIDTAGAVVGQVNGLSVASLGEYSFGHPSRITARVRMGRGTVLDIEREVELGGPIHSKGVLILGSFLAGRYALQTPLSLQASLVFEQSYGAVEGDSASAAELFALLSAIASVPVAQRIAVTGSVNQRGEVQPVGAIHEKIEGFFDLCRRRGLTGDQGVLVPEANRRHLMLRRDVVEAVEAGQFQICSMRTIDDGIELLTGLAAGERDESGAFPPGSVNQLVELQLEEFAKRRREFDAPVVAPPAPEPALGHG